jgi:hypothetical protein
MNLARYVTPLKELDTFYIWDDFLYDQIDTAGFVDTVTDSGSVAMGDDVGGVATLTPSDGTVADNDEAYLATPNEVFKFAAGKPIYLRARVKYTEVTSDKVNVAVGLQNAVGANSLVDDGGGPKVSGSTLAIAKVDGGSNYAKCYSACNGTSTVTTSTKVLAANTWYVFEIACNDWDGTSMQVTFKIDGEYLKDSNGNVIRHTVAIASATEMQAFLGVKLGAATNNDTLLADYLFASQAR